MGTSPDKTMQQLPPSQASAGTLINVHKYAHTLINMSKCTHTQISLCYHTFQIPSLHTPPTQSTHDAWKPRKLIFTLRLPPFQSSPPSHLIIIPVNHATWETRLRNLLQKQTKPKVEDLATLCQTSRSSLVSVRRRPRLVAADSTDWLNLRNTEETVPLTTAEELG